MERIINVEVVFYENARKTSPLGNVYRPHFIVDGSDVYLGIQFIHLKNVPLGKRIISKVELLYDGVDYSQLKQDTHFIIKEGTESVGEGVVLTDF